MKCPTCKGTGKMSSATMGDKLRIARMEKGESLRDVEAATGVSNALISQIETGKIQGPSFDYVMRLCAHYEIKAESLLSDSNDAISQEGK